MISNLLFFLFCFILGSTQELFYDRLADTDINLSSIKAEWSYVYFGNLYYIETSEIVTCNNNQRDSLTITGNQPLDCYFSLQQPYYQISIYLDIYLQGTTSQLNKYYTIQLNNVVIHTRSYFTNSLSSYGKICTSTLTKFEQQTLVYTGAITGSTIEIILSADTSKKVSFRDMQIFLSQCHYSCKTCNGGSNNQCLTCYYGIATSGICPSCPVNLSFFNINNASSCVQECQRTGYLSNGQQFCQIYPNIGKLIDHFANNTFTLASPFTKILDSDYSTTPILQTFSLSCASLTITKFTGYLQYNEGVSLQLSLQQNIILLRLRVTFTVQNWLDYSRLTIYLDNIVISSLYLLNNVFVYENAKPLLVVTNCKIVRIETILQINNQTPVLKIIGNMNPSNVDQKWGFNNILIDQAACSLNCLTCNQQRQCTSCSTTYFLYRGQCVYSCPVYSFQSASICTDFEDFTAHSQYLIKGFYDRKQLLPELNEIVGTFTSEGPNFETTINKTINQQVIFSYLPWKKILGGPLIWNKGYFTKIFTNLNPNYQVQLKITIILGDGITGDFFYVIDSLNKTITSNPFTQSNIAGGQAQEKIYTLVDSQSHFNSQLTIQLHCYARTTTIEDGFCGVYDYFVVINYCFPYCLACKGPANSDCTQWPTPIPAQVLVFTPFQCNVGQHLDYNVRPYTCSSCLQYGCQACTSQEVCNQCDTTNGFILAGVNCICQSKKYLIGEHCQDCHPHCQTCFGASVNQCLTCSSSDNRFLSINTCACKSGYNISGDLCQMNCQAAQTLLTTQCYDTTTSYYLSFPNCVKCSKQCDSSCINCLSDGCQQCDEINGWYLINQTCIQCPDNSYYDADFIECKTCSSNCLTCQDSANTCLTCTDGLFLNSVSSSCDQCQPPCYFCSGTALTCQSCLDVNAILIPDTCICMDGYYQTFEQICEICTAPCQMCAIASTYCLSCQSDLYILNSDLGSCECSQGYIEQDAECKQCQLPCLLCEQTVTHCLQCVDNNQMLNMQYQCQCLSGYQMNSSFLCDEIIAVEISTYSDTDEQDEQILKPNTDNINSDDTTSETENLRQQSEIVCGENSLLENGKCINLCGNGLLDVRYETCDDGNSIGGDGCTRLCEEEEQWQCINVPDALSQCILIMYPHFSLNVISDSKNSQQIVELTFSEKVKLIQDILLEDFIEVTITPTTQFELSYLSIQRATLQLTDVKYQIIVQFKEQITDPMMQFTILHPNLVNSNNLSLINLSQEIPLGAPFILSTSSQKKVNTTVEMNQIMIYSMAGVSGLALITGNPLMFFGTLDLLQQLSYLKYIEMEKPAHLKQFLEMFSKISLKPLMDSLQIDYYLAKLNGGRLPFINGQKANTTSTQQSQISAINAYYLINAKSCYVTFGISYVVYQICIILTSSKLSESLLNFFSRRKWSIKKHSQYYNLFFKIKWACQQQRMAYFNSGLLQMFQSVEHQLLFSAMLQFPNYYCSSIFDYLNSLNAICGMLIPIYISFLVIDKANLQNQITLKWSYFFQQIKSSRFPILQRPVQLIKTIVYLGSIIFLNNYPQVQSISLSITSAFYCIYLIKYRPFQSVLDNIKVIIKEFCFLIATGSFLIYSFKLNDNQYFIVGWIHIGLFSSILGSNLVIDLVKQIDHICFEYKKMCERKILQQQKLYKHNKLQDFVTIEYRKNTVQLSTK